MKRMTNLKIRYNNLQQIKQIETHVDVIKSVLTQLQKSINLEIKQIENNSKLNKK